MTQPNDVFRTMSSDESQALLKEMREEVLPLYRQVENVAASTLRLRPVFLRKQPFEKRCEMIRKALALKVNVETTAEVLAGFFIERYSDELTELLDALKVEHEEGVLKEANPTSPKKNVLTQAVKKFREGENPIMRSLLLRAFAAQGAIDWPELDAMVFPEEATASSA